ncbi:MAG: hypothetical protein ABSA12_08905 [Verrucomicrobiia bacterium]|jgi:hypothetical protein
MKINFPHFISLIVILSLPASVTDATEAIDAPSKPEKPLADRVLAHDYPSIARPWGLCVDFSNEERHRDIVKHDISWESIGRGRDGLGDRAIGANWAGNYRALGTNFANLNDCLERRRTLLASNPNAVVLAELRWRDYTDSSLPENHDFWKRDPSGNRIVAKGDKMNEPRYYLDNDNPHLVKHLLIEAKYIVESGAYDGVFLDWFGPSATFLKQLRETIGSRYLIIVNANYKYDPERAQYINGAYLECYKTNNPASLEQWEHTVQSPKVNVLDMMGEPTGCTGSPDLQRMRNTTTYSLVHSDGYVLYGDHFHKHRWFPFWDAKLGKPLSDGVQISKDSYRREFEKGFAINNSNEDSVTVTLPRLVKRLSDGSSGTMFTIHGNDGDIFLKAE